MSHTALLAVRAAEETHRLEGVNHWYVGLAVFLLLLVLMGGLLIFGAGRPHS
jgi:hypothetical protein